METGSVIELIPAVHIVKAIDNTIHTGSTRRVTLMQLFKDINSVGTEVVLPTVLNRYEQKPVVAKDLRVVGTGVFIDDKLVGFLDEFQTRGYLWATGQLKGGALVIPSPDDPSDLISLEILEVDSKMSVAIVNGEFILKVKVKSTFNIAEQQTTKDLSTPEMMKYIEEKSEALIKQEIQSALQQGQEVFKGDYFGFGEIVAKNFPAHWNNKKNEWNKTFSKATVEFDITSKLRRTGQISKSSQPR